MEWLIYKKQLLIAAVSLVALSVVLIVMLATDTDADLSSLNTKSQPSVHKAQLGAEQNIGDYTLFPMPPILAESQLDEILVRGDALWIGSDKGLVKVQGKTLTLYRQFENVAYEMVRELVALPDGIAVQLSLAHSYGKETALGSYVFNTQLEQWQKVGDTAMAQAWLDGYLYQANTGLIRRNPEQDWKQEPVLDSVCQGAPSSLTMRAIDAEIWLVGDGSFVDNIGVRTFGCGVLRYSPKNQEARLYTTEHGLNHNSAWDIAGGMMGQGSGVYVTHWLKDIYVSLLEPGAKQWVSLIGAGTGNNMAVHEESVWLASTFASKPIITVGRDAVTGRSLAPIDRNEVVSAVAFQGPRLWFTTSAKVWIRGKSSIRSRLGYTLVAKSD
ncbi:MAG: hypothetical protein OEZ68_16295 [Gammaproteobacteria bacterium]|nr:hypothetical protein [Gammaproteobacteria bacterium]MDH5802362.1 hypothetical protein [Gammaproteobacteria bacterium]